MMKQAARERRQAVMANPRAHELAQVVIAITGAMWQAMYYAADLAAALDLLARYDLGIRRLTTLGVAADMQAGLDSASYDDPVVFMEWLAGQWLAVEEGTGNRAAVEGAIRKQGDGFLVITPLYPLCKFTYTHLGMTHQELTGREEAIDDAR